MGAWGIGVFQNDSALDWVLELEGVGDLTLVTETFDFFEALGNSADLWDCADALAAAEIVAAMHGSPSGALPQEACEWLYCRGFAPDHALRERAYRVVERIRDASQLRQCWAQAGLEGDWCDLLDDLLSRI